MILALLISIKKNAIKAIVGLLWFNIVSAQNATFQLLTKIDIEAKEIQTDRMGNLYIISKTNQLYKYTPEGKLLATLNYNYAGNISLIDVSNPLEIYVFYKELNSLVFLDNNLAFRGDINLSSFGVGQASCMARSYDNGIWVFDVVDLQLKKITKEGDITLQSANVRQYTQAKTLMPSFMYDNNDRLYVNDSALGIMVFDVFTNYIKTLPIKGIVDFKISGDELFFNKNGILSSYNLRVQTQRSVQLPDSNVVLDFSVERNRLYLLKENRVEIFETK